MKMLLQWQKPKQPPVNSIRLGIVGLLVCLPILMQPMPIIVFAIIAIIEEKRIHNIRHNTLLDNKKPFFNEKRKG